MAVPKLSDTLISGLGRHGLGERFGAWASDFLGSPAGLVGPPRGGVIGALGAFARDNPVAAYYGAAAVVGAGYGLISSNSSVFGGMTGALTLAHMASAGRSGYQAYSMMGSKKYAEAGIMDLASGVGRAMWSNTAHAGGALWNTARKVPTLFSNQSPNAVKSSLKS